MALESLFLLKALAFAALMTALFVVYPAIRRSRRRKSGSVESRERVTKEENAR